jgi:hypothetical protein
VFTREAVGLLCEASLGLPRTINVLADNALLGGFAAGVKPVGRDLVLDVCRDFDLLGGVDLSRSETPAPGLPMPRLDTLPRPTPTAGEKPPVPGPAPQARDSEMFGAFSARRKRFSFFWN